MVLRALLVSEDDGAIAILTSVLSEFAVTADRCAYPTGMFCLPEYKLDALIVDFDHADQATSIVQSIRNLPFPPLIISILKDQSGVRNAFAAGANFVLYKPISEDQARASLRSAVGLMKRERRRCFRVALQVPVQLQLEDGTEKEGIILDLSEDGMDILTANPICPSSRLRAQFTLPGSLDKIELSGIIAWANPNGQSGMRFGEISESLHNKFREFVDSHAPELPVEDRWQEAECKLTDLSLGACYIDTESPFPEHSVVKLCLAASDMEVCAEGTVHVMHPGVGMGIEFASRTIAQRNEVQSLLNLLTSSPGTLPKLTITPCALFASEDFNNENANALDDPLLQLLRNHESFNQEEFLHELQQQRTSQEVVAG
jgi:DNA-binding NarL/FixJ family response regulator